MPLGMFEAGRGGIIKRIGGKDEVRHFLETLGFVVGSMVTVISKNKDNIIVGVRDSRVAISGEMAKKIFC